MTAGSNFRTTKLYDVLAAAPLLVLYGLGIAAKLIPDMLTELGRLASLRAWLDLARDSSNIVYFGLIITLVFLRRTPIGRSTGVFPRLLALTSAYLALARPKLLPFSHLPVWLEAGSIALTVIGTSLSIAVLLKLGRSFSILPEARVLVTDGPYRIVRHPLYVAEEIGNIGIMLQYLQPWSLLIEVVNVSLQIWRMSIEECVLLRHFPAYAAYAARTRRIIPGVY